MDKVDWSEGVESEFQFWKQWLENKGGRWPADFQERSDANLELQPEISDFLTDFPDEPLKLLDVGAGPMTYVGKVFKGRRIALTATDALGDLYAQLEFPPGLPLVRTESCDGECLTGAYPLDHFDVAYSRNALDHGYDPIRAIQEMIAVTRPGGVIIITNWENEATKENWQGFHQWNFAIADGKFTISNRAESFDVFEIVKASVETVHLGCENEGILWVMRKKA